MFTYTSVHVFLFLKMIYLSLVYECLPECIFAAYMCSSHGDRQGHWVPYNCRYRWLWGATWVLVTQPRSSARAANGLSPGPFLQSPVSALASLKRGAFLPIVSQILRFKFCLQLSNVTKWFPIRSQLTV